MRKYTASVKELGEGEPWILIESNNEDDGVPDGSSIVMYFAKGTSIEAANAVASCLNDNVEEIKISKL